MVHHARVAFVIGQNHRQRNAQNLNLVQILCYHSRQLLNGLILVFPAPQIPLDENHPAFLRCYLMLKRTY